MEIHRSLRLLEAGEQCGEINASFVGFVAAVGQIDQLTRHRIAVGLS